ncbi:glutathione peroxidase [Lachnotalea glycerini]|uniref:Glutathione peroxidase n=1 Tax=Lachnotalea glycerini TaxID=1763509 RepID=A0A318EPQ1_9FIRM|nr:glutathione peroxidase [Lachnotalea glycerini]OYP47866.1 glutathione peroxidase [Lachnotalea glycerini]PXV93451.1 glutathione peroxidase [Lachnotalea glycerini]
MNIYDYKVKKSNGEMQSISDYKGKVLLIVNTATGCGFTPQYEGLQKLYDKYKDQGFIVLDFPCNQFANQAPGTGEEIHEFCQLNYQVSFPQFAKIDVNGEKEDLLFTFLKSQQKGILSNKIKWNFTKFLVDRDGKVLERFAPATIPEKIEEKIKNILR